MHYVAPYRLVDTGRLTGHLLGEHILDLKKSGLTDQTIRAAGIYTLAPGDVGRFLTAKRNAVVDSCLCFPYQGGSFARVKLFPPIGTQKYSQPPQTSARLYIPFAIKPGPVYVCEGEKKTLAACQAGLNAIGIGGVWNWLGHGEPIDDLNKITWTERQVILVGDSDIWHRTDLLKALYALGAELAQAGAGVEFLEIPGEDDSKTGLDDYLVSGGSLDALASHFIGSKRLSRHRPWYQNWKLDKAMARA